MITPDEWRAGGSTMRWRDHDIFTRVDGAGDPVVAVHGFPTASWDYAAMWPRLTERYRAITLDLLGFGFSAKPRDAAYSIMAQTDLVEAVIAREGVTRYRLLAHDYGVTIAQELLARQREGAAARISSVVLLNGGLFPETHRARRSQRVLASRAGPLLARFITYGAFARGMYEIWGAKRLPELELRAMWQLVTADDGLRALPPLLHYMAERREHRERWVGALVGAEQPIRLINGLRDPVSGAHMVARYRELVAAPDVVELPDVGHYPQVEAPDAVANATLDFFGRVR